MKKLRKALLVVLMLSCFTCIKIDNAFATKIRTSQSYPLLVLASSKKLHKYTSNFEDNCISIGHLKIDSKIKSSATPLISCTFIKQTSDCMYKLEKKAKKVSYRNFLSERREYADVSPQDSDVNIIFSDSQESICVDNSQAILPASTGYLPANELSDEGKQYFEELSRQTLQFLEEKNNTQNVNIANITVTNTSVNNDSGVENIFINHKRPCSFVSQDWDANLDLNLDLDEE